VSTKFNLHATKYFRSLQQFDLSILKENYAWHSKNIVKPHTCLLETVTKYCDNLEQVTGIQIYSEKLNLASRTCLQKLPKLTSIVIIDGLLKTADLFGFLLSLPILRSAKVGKFENPRDENGNELENENVTEEEKITVSELSLDRGDFWRIFRVDRLKKVAISSSMFRTKKDVNTFCCVVARCQRLEQLEVEICAKYCCVFPSLLRLPAILPNLKQFTLNLQGGSMDKVALIARQYPSIRKYLQTLEITHSKPAGDWIYVFFKSKILGMGRGRNIKKRGSGSQISNVAGPGPMLEIPSFN